MVPCGPRCVGEDCKTRPSFGMPGGQPISCAGHKAPDMIRLTGGRCDCPEGCDRHPSFGPPGGKASRCLKHKEPGMTSTYGYRYVRQRPEKRKRRMPGGEGDEREDEE